MTDDPAMRYRKTATVEAIQWTGNDVPWSFIGGLDRGVTISDLDHRDLIIRTLEGAMTCSPGDWIIRGVKGELYPCKPDIFAASYEIDAPPSDTEVTGLIQELRELAPHGFLIADEAASALVRLAAENARLKYGIGALLQVVGCLTDELEPKGYTFKHEPHQRAMDAICDLMDGKSCPKNLLPFEAKNLRAEDAEAHMTGIIAALSNSYFYLDEMAHVWRSMRFADSPVHDPVLIEALSAAKATGKEK